MTDTQNGTNAVVVRKPDVSMKEFGSREDVAALSRRIVTMMPGGNKLTPEQALATAQYALAIGANPFHDIYAFESKGQLQIVEHYRLIVSWAKAKCDYSEWFTPIDDLPATQVGFWCHILRVDKQDFLSKLLTHGMDLDRAMDIVTTRAGGVANKGEDPPKGWTIADVAQKRALKNALNRSHGAPTPAEIARESWNINGRETQAEDWEDVTAEMTRTEAEATADYSARERERHAAPATVENAQEAIGDLFAEELEARPQKLAKPDQAEDVTESDPPPPGDAPHMWTIEESDHLYAWTSERDIGGDQVITALNVDRLSEFTGDVDTAKRCIDAWIAAEQAAETETEQAELPMEEGAQ